MRVVVVGAGAVGSRVGRQLLESGVEELTLVGRGSLGARSAATSLGHDVNLTRWAPSVCDEASVMVIATPHDHVVFAKAAIERGVHVVSTTDNVDDTRELLELDEKAKAANVSLAIGAGFSPGLSCVLARNGARKLDTVEEVLISKFGTGGPACARNHHRALASNAVDWRDGGWDEGPGGSGRELCWFPDPIGGADCYRGALSDSLLLQPAFPEADRITSRMAATRRDRLTSRFPMMRKPHPEGLLGGLRVEVRGKKDGQQETVIYGAIDRPAVGTAMVAALTAAWAADGKLSRPGAGGLAELIEGPATFLDELATRGVRAVAFEGV